MSLEIVQKPNQIAPLAGFFHGIDPATKGDYYVDIIHLLPQKPRAMAGVKPSSFKWVPYLCHAVRLKKRSPNEIVDIQIDLFNRFPPMLATIDASREDFLANALTRKYGERKIIQMKFVNSGQSNTKFKLKQLGYAFIQAGYEWPNPVKIEKTHPKLAKIIRILKKEMMHEQVIETNNNRISFTHPVGKHNDLVHGWEMSLNSVMEFQQKNLGFEKRQIKDNTVKQTIPSTIKPKPQAKDYDDTEEDDVMARLKNSGINKLPF